MRSQEITLEVYVRATHLPAFRAMVTEHYQPHMIRIDAERKRKSQSENTPPGYLVQLTACDAQTLWDVAAQWAQLKAEL